MLTTYRYLILTLLLLALGLVFMLAPEIRVPVAIIIGLTYFFWGIISHCLDKNLHWLVALEYFAFALLAVIMLIFLSLRA